MTLTGSEKRMVTTAATRARRQGQDLRVRELKLARLNKQQKEWIERAFLEAKWLRNSIVSHGIFDFRLSEHGVSVKLPDGSFEQRELRVLPAHVKQTIHKGLKSATKSLSSNKKAGRTVGSVGYSARVNSMEFPTGDVWVRNNRARIPRLGIVKVRGAHQLGEEIANVRIIRKASGYYLKVSSLTAKETPKFTKPPVGLDFGIKTHITNSEGDEWNVMAEEPERLRGLRLAR